jgi:hypothetical protein
MRISFLAVPLMMAVGPAFAAAPQPIAAQARTPLYAKPLGNMPVVEPGGPKAGNCPVTSRYEAMKRKGEKLTDRKLSDLPPGDLYLAVYRRIDGCEVPIMASKPFDPASYRKILIVPGRPAR